MSRTATVVRELVRHLNGDHRAYSLLARLLEDLDASLAPLVPPPPAHQPSERLQAPERTPEPVYSQPRSQRRR